jgi:hypothetical protein
MTGQEIGWTIFCIICLAVAGAYGYVLGMITGYARAQRAYSWALSFKAIGNNVNLVTPLKSSFLLVEGSYMGVATENVKCGDMVEIRSKKLKV